LGAGSCQYSQAKREDRGRIDPDFESGTRRDADRKGALEVILSMKLHSDLSRNTAYRGCSPNAKMSREAEIGQGLTSPPSALRVAIVEDHREFRDYLAALVGGAEGFCCTGSYRSMEEALEKIAHNLPDAVLVDIGLPGMSGVEGVRVLKERYPQLVLLMQTVYEDDERIFDALCAGASGYLLK